MTARIAGASAQRARAGHEMFGLDTDFIGKSESLRQAVVRRVGGKAPLDPFGLDPALSDSFAPLLGFSVRVQVFGGQHIPRSGPGVLMMHRGFGVLEPTALTVAVMRETRRRVRVAGAPEAWGIGTLLRRLGAIAASPEDVGAALRSDYLVVVPLAPSWLGSRAGVPPLDLMQTVMGVPVLPVSVKPIGVFGAPLGGWRVSIGAPVELDPTTPIGDPLGAAELAESVRIAVDNLG